jgi:hypothetical protein
VSARGISFGHRKGVTLPARTSLGSRSAAFAACLCATVFLVPAVVSAQDALKFKTPDSWGIGNTSGTKDVMLVEMVKIGESIKAWTELLSILQGPRTKAMKTARHGYEMFRGAGEARCPGMTASWEVLHEEPNTILYQWRTTGSCKNQLPQWEVARVLLGRKAVYRVAYTTVTELSSETRSTWIEWLNSVSLQK